jgi:hypothetical protein
MLLLRTGWTGDAERSDQAMNALANLYVNMHLQELLDEAAQDRARRVAQPSLRTRIASALSSFGQSLKGRPALPA